MKFEVLYPSSSNPRKNIGAYLQQQLKLLGIDVEVRGLDFNAYTERSHARRTSISRCQRMAAAVLIPTWGARARLSALVNKMSPD